MSCRVASLYSLHVNTISCKKLKDQNVSERKLENKFETKIPDRFLRVQDEIGVLFIFNLFSRDLACMFWGKMLRGAILNFFPKILSGEMLCNVSSIFPPKV